MPCTAYPCDCYSDPYTGNPRQSNAGYERVQVSVVGTLCVRWSSGMDDEERIWSSGKIVMP